MNQIYGFQGEIKAKYDMRLFNLFTEGFFNDLFFFVHSLHFFYFFGLLNLSLSLPASCVISAWQFFYVSALFFFLNVKNSRGKKKAFNFLPLASVLNHKVLVVHGGLFSEDGVTLEDLKKIDRNQQPPQSG